MDSYNFYDIGYVLECCELCIENYGYVLNCPSCDFEHGFYDDDHKLECENGDMEDVFVYYYENIPPEGLILTCEICDYKFSVNKG